jgi:hypothetical protein
MGLPVESCLTKNGLDLLLFVVNLDAGEFFPFRGHSVNGAVSPKVFDFMGPIKTGFRVAVNAFSLSVGHAI